MNRQKSLPPVIQTGPVASTNSYVQHLLAQDMVFPELTVWVSGCQTEGRGQGDHQWESEPGRNITCSILLRPAFLPVRDQFDLSACVALAVRDLVAEFVSETSVKWPNDIYVDDRKVAGILIEHTLSGRDIRHSVIGIGLNVNQKVFVSDAPNPVSLYQLTGREYNLDDVAERLQRRLSDRYETLRAGWTDDESLLQDMRSEYLRHLYRFGKWCRYKDADGEFEGCITGVTPQGFLQIGRHDGTVRQFDLKEVQFLPPRPVAHDLNNA